MMTLRRLLFGRITPALGPERGLKLISAAEKVVRGIITPALGPECGLKQDDPGGTVESRESLRPSGRSAD